MYLLRTIDDSIPASCYYISLIKHVKRMLTVQYVVITFRWNKWLIFFNFFLKLILFLILIVWYIGLLQLVSYYLMFINRIINHINEKVHFINFSYHKKPFKLDIYKKGLLINYSSVVPQNFFITYAKDKPWKPLAK